MTDGLDNGVPLSPYTAGANGRRLKLWRTPLAGPNAAGANGTTIVSRARHAARNDPWFGAALLRGGSNAIGTGIQAKPKWGTEVQKAEQKRLWDRWIPVADADGVLDWYGLQALAWNEWKEAGEVFVRLRARRASDGLPVPLQLQLIESEQCPRDYWSTASNGNAIRAGIEFDAIGRRVAYWMTRSHPGDQSLDLRGNELVRVPADQILHLYRPTRAGQYRGMPDAAAVLALGFNIENLRDAVLERQKIANLFTGWYVSDASVPGDGGMLQDMQTGIDADDTPLAGLEPGTMQELPPGMEPKFSEPPGPGQDYAEFMRTSLMAYAARLGIPYEVLTGDLRNVSDRALRLILNEFRRLIEMDVWLYLVPQFCQKVRAAWFDAAVLGGALDIAGYADIRAEVIDTLWVPQGWPYSHPVQDVDADIKAIRGGLQSRTGTILANGDDPEQIDAEQVEDNARADALGLKHDSDGREAKRGANQAAKPPGEPTHEP